MAKKKKQAASRRQLQLGDVHSKWFDYVGELACILDGTCHVVLNTENWTVQGGAWSTITAGGDQPKLTAL